MKEKTGYILGLLVLVFFSGCNQEPTLYSIGDTGPSGAGIVFYIENDGRNGLEAAPTGWNGGGSDPLLKWKTSLDETPGTSTDIGKGYENTYTHMTGDEHPAAAECRGYSGGGADDWFLPSIDELAELYDTRDIVGDFEEELYWSSSESDSAGGWAFSFIPGGNASQNDKNTEYRIRPVREF